MIKTWRRSSVGVDDVKWSPKWVWQDGMAGIPFDSLTDTPPEDNSKWLIRLTQNRKTWPENDFATLQFCGTSDIGRSVLWWTGSIDRDAKQHASIKKAFDDIGWKIRIAEQGALIRELPAADIYAFRNPSNKPNPLSKDDYEFLREKIRNGATGFFASYSGFALEKIFADPSYKVSVNGIRNTLLGQRRTRTLYPGAWTENPHKIKNA